MKIIIPAKKSSSRVPDKNWRPFYKDKNLVQIKIEQVLKCIEPDNIYLSCEDESKRGIADAYRIHFLQRNPAYASDETPWPDALHGIISETDFDGSEEIAWVEVINPLFDNFQKLFEAWHENKSTCDSLVLASPINKFLLSGLGKPVNFQFGKWHAMSQHMDPFYAWDSACIMHKKDLLYYSYPIGRKPYLFSTGEQCIDIDTLHDFELAQYFYSNKNVLESRK